MGEKRSTPPVGEQLRTGQDVFISRSGSGIESAKIIGSDAEGNVRVGIETTGGVIEHDVDPDQFKAMNAPGPKDMIGALLLLREEEKSRLSTGTTSPTESYLKKWAQEQLRLMSEGEAEHENVLSAVKVEVLRQASERWGIKASTIEGVISGRSERLPNLESRLGRAKNFRDEMDMILAEARDRGSSPEKIVELKTARELMDGICANVNAEVQSLKSGGLFELLRAVVIMQRYLTEKQK